MFLAASLQFQMWICMVVVCFVAVFLNQRIITSWAWLAITFTLIDCTRWTRKWNVNYSLNFIWCDRVRYWRRGKIRNTLKCNKRELIEREIGLGSVGTSHTFICECTTISYGWLSCWSTDIWRRYRGFVLFHNLSFLRKLFFN